MGFFLSGDQGLSNRDKLFLRFILGIFALMLMYGIGMILVLIFVSESTGLRMVSGFASMFAGILGLGSGYLLGRSNNGHT